MSSLVGTGTDVNHPFGNTLGRQQVLSNGQAMGTMLPLGKLIPQIECLLMPKSRKILKKDKKTFFNEKVKILFLQISGTLNTSNHSAIGSNTLLPYKRSNVGVNNHYPSQSQTLLRYFKFNQAHFTSLLFKVFTLCLPIN